MNMQIVGIHQSFDPGIIIEVSVRYLYFQVSILQSIIIKSSEVEVEEALTKVKRV